MGQGFGVDVMSATGFGQDAENLGLKTSSERTAATAADKKRALEYLNWITEMYQAQQASNPQQTFGYQPTNSSARDVLEQMMAGGGGNTGVYSGPGSFGSQWDAQMAAESAASQRYNRTPHGYQGPTYNPQTFEAPTKRVDNAYADDTRRALFDVHNEEKKDSAGDEQWYEKLFGGVG